MQTICVYECNMAGVHIYGDAAEMFGILRIDKILNSKDPRGSMVGEFCVWGEIGYTEGVAGSSFGIATSWYPGGPPTSHIWIQRQLMLLALCASESFDVFRLDLSRFSVDLSPMLEVVKLAMNGLPDNLKIVTGD